MKKLFKLFLCLLMLVSFTNVAKALGEEEYVSALDVANNYNKTNLIEGLLIEARREDPTANLEVNIDEENHTFSIVDADEEAEESFEMVFHYTDEYISYIGAPIETEEDVDLRVFAESIYINNLYLAVLDTMGYNDVELYPEEDDDLDEEFYNQYGLYVETQDYSFESEDGATSGTSIKEVRVSLDKNKIAAAVEALGGERTDYVGIFSSILHEPELTIKKKGSKVVVSWLEDQNAEKFIVYRTDKKDGKFKKLDTITKNSYTDKKVTYGKTYYYQVKAVGEDGTSATSEVVKFKVVPDKVQNVKVGSIKTTSVKVSFDKVSETGYVIERSKDNEKWEKVTTITKNSTVSYKDKKLKANKTYYYRVRAYKTVSGKKVYGKYSDVVSVKTAPEAPTFTVKENNYQSLKLTITSVKGAKRYEVYRASKKDGEFKKVADLDEEELKYIDNELKIDKKYYYKVRACNVDNKCGDYSSVVNRKVALVTPKITLEGSKTVPMTIKMSKIDLTDAIQIYRAESKNGKYKKIKTLDSAFDTYIDESAKKNKTYYYKVRTYILLDGKKYYSEYSSVKSLKNVYSPTSVNKLKAEKITDFNGVYRKGAVVLKAYSKNDEYVTVFFEERGEGEENTSSYAQYDLEFNNGVASTDFFDEKLTLELTEKGVFFTEPEGKLKGEYEKESGYTLDEFYADMLGDEEYLTTKYNGVFENEKGEKLYIYQSDKESGRFDTQIGEKSYGIELEITDEKATAELFDDNFEIVVEDNVLTLKVYENKELTIDETFTKKADITKEEIVEKFS